MNLRSSFMVLSVLCMLVAVYVFLVNLVVANDRLLASQKVIPTQPQNKTRRVNGTDIRESTALGASLTAYVHPRYGILPIHSSVFGDLKLIHRIFMWLLYLLGVSSLIRVNKIVLVGGEEASDLLRGLAWTLGIFVAGFLMQFVRNRLIHDFGYALTKYAFATFVFVGFLFLVRIYAYTHVGIWSKLVGLKNRIW